MRVAALYRSPVKGFTREACHTPEVLPGGRIAGDRVLGLRFANAAAADEAWGPRFDFVALVNTPALTRSAVRLRERVSRAREHRVLSRRVAARSLEAARGHRETHAAVKLRPGAATPIAPLDALVRAAYRDIQARVGGVA